MRRSIANIVLAIFFCGCNNTQVLQPVWIKKADTLTLTNTLVNFKSVDKSWSAILITFVQPIKMVVQYNDTGFSAKPERSYGILEGPAQICLSKENHHFFYPVYLKNKDSLSYSYKDYRLPKTVNPDSSLIQQRMIHTIDEYRNLVFIPGKKQYFFEEKIALSPKTATIRAISKESLSSFYILPGSVVNIPLKVVYNKMDLAYIATVGPLKDKYNNTVADGTKVNFIYTIDSMTYRREVSLLNGFANLSLPSDKLIAINMQAIINDTYSNNVKLKP